MIVYDTRPVYPLGVLQGNQSYPPIEDIIKELEECSSKAQHGGTMTTLVELALKEGFIDSAVLTRSKGGLDAEGVLAVTPEEIRACSGSSFQIPPTLAILNQALNENHYKKIGIVGTPCKTLAVYKMKSKPLPSAKNEREPIIYQRCKTQKIP